ncbi:hypothetical protein [Nitrosomonas aestuarii]|uniref:hypothetical protein n=1 Tax=Nitrosomonas aestuarii TaxID=52441 RepID=UPI000D31D8B8|nr:hypothetical protein [Nitrosomonas aestuarii]PTN10741.1 hypothetical protein C8R11_11937 [Nitrosomonas aestuarii]
MNPIVPIIMAFGAVLFLVGVIVLARLTVKKTKTIKFFGKEYRLWRFVFTTTSSGMALIMLSIYTHKLLPPESIQSESTQAVIGVSSNLRYELETILPNDQNNARMLNTITRFQKEYQEALQNKDKITLDILTMEMTQIIELELEKQEHPSHQISSEINRIMRFLKQKPD